MKYLTVLLIAFTLGLNTAYSKMHHYGNVVVDEVSSVYDGDTFRVTIKDWPAIIGERIPVRPRGVDTPEIKGPRCERERTLARKAKQYTVAKLRNAKTIELKNIQRGGRFRIIADVYVDGKSLAEDLINTGHGRACKECYRKNATWCAGQ